MNGIVNRTVTHKAFGIGVITEVNTTSIVVQFKDQVKKFQYPSSFETFLTFEDANLQESVMKDALSMKEQIKVEKDSAMQATLDTLLKPQVTQKKKAKKSTTPSKNSVLMKSIHIKCFEILLDKQKENTSLFFIPRKANINGKLEDGYLFMGNDDYMLVTFWDGSDKTEKIYNINFGISVDESAFIELCSVDSDEKALHLKHVADLLQEKYGMTFKEVKANKWRYDYPKSLNYVDVLTHFIENEKVIIDEYVVSTPSFAIKLADNKIQKKYVDRIITMHHL